MVFPLALPCQVASLFHDPSSTAFADLTIDGHRETWPIRSRQFRHWLRRRYFEETGSAASAETVRSALDLLEARAQFDAPERMVHIRIAEHDDRIYLDLADNDWRAIQIGPDGWQVVTSPPVRFRRAAGMLPLPVPQRGGSIEALAAFLNLPAADEFVLVIAWLLAALQRGGPYPLLVIAGEQGSAKTVLTKILRALIDPNAAPTRALPRERPTPWPFLFGRSWPSAAHGQEGPRIFYAFVLPQAKMCWTEPQDGRKIRAPWPADCVAARHSSGPSALILPLVAKAERAAG
jgi:hypothetical protein